MTVIDGMRTSIRGKSMKTHSIAALAMLVLIPNVALAQSTPAAGAAAIDSKFAPFQKFTLLDCSDAVCTAEITTVPTGRNLLIRFVSCFANGGKGSAVSSASVLIGDKKGAAYIPSTELVAGRETFTMTSTVFLIARSKQSVSILVDAAPGPINASGCTVSGEYF